MLTSRLPLHRGVVNRRIATLFLSTKSQQEHAIRRPAEKDMAESDFQFRIKKEAELNEVVTLLAHTLRNQYSTVVLRGRHPSSVLMSLKAVTAAAYRASKVIDLTFRGPPLEWPTTEQKEEFERWAEMEGGTEIWIGARIGQAHCGGRAWEDILVQPEMSSAELAATVSELIKRESSLRIIGLDAVSCATIADAIAIASQTCTDLGGLVCQADFTKVNVDPRNHRPVGESIPDGLDAEDLITESVRVKAINASIKCHLGLCRGHSGNVTCKARKSHVRDIGPRPNDEKANSMAVEPSLAKIRY